MAKTTKTKMVATREQAVGIYRETLKLMKVSVAEKADFDAHLMHIVDCPQSATLRPDRHGRVVYACLHMLMNEFTKRDHRISPETLEWGGFMSGTITYDHAPGQEVVAVVSAKVGLAVKFHGHHISF